MMKEFITNNNDNSTLFVLKGFDLEAFGYSKVFLAETMDNKMQRLMQLSMEPEKVIAYDEFVCLYDLAVSLFKKIVILENPLYLNLYPVNAFLPDSVKQALLIHFDEENKEETDIRDAEPYSAVYSNFIQTSAGIACCYNLEGYALMAENIVRVELCNFEDRNLEQTAEEEAYPYINICTNADYFELLGLLDKTESPVIVNFCSYAGGLEMMEAALKRANGFFGGRILVTKAGHSGRGECAHYPEVSELMKKYWGYDTFRNLKVYDMDSVDKGQKKVTEVSQEKIVSDLITQVENCRNGHGARDLFVTAPTGAGKSLMFQLPAMYLAEKYNFLTIVITPLIGLMNDQVQALNDKGYHAARTINSDISPIIKNEIMEEVMNGSCSILYLSPESLLSRSDISQLIGSRRIGMLVVDEAHIVSTWGKQFRPDYWYLGDHVHKLRTAQSKAEENPMSFVIATFTATAIYKGEEDMYNETLNSLHMVDPITYLGYVKRENIAIEVKEIEAKHNRVEYELDKFDAMIERIMCALARDQKMLIYFPTVALIERFYTYCYSKNLKPYVAKYHGQMHADQKDENFRAFLAGDRRIMLATKAFGMGIDIPDIAIVSHYAPTGNVCDYMQEIGRAARDIHVDGHAVYEHMNTDFQHINRLHGLSSVYENQLVNVIKKILELYEAERYQDNGGEYTRKRNEMLIDTEAFAYIFDGPMSDESTLVNKVKTAMLLIQKDYENRGFTPFRMRPIPLFAYGFLTMDPEVSNRLNVAYPNSVEVVDRKRHICKVNLKNIWQRSYQKEMSFPKFKFLLYTGNADLKFNQTYPFATAMEVSIAMENDGKLVFENVYQALKDTLNESVRENRFFTEEEMVQVLSKRAHISRFKAENIVRVVLAAFNAYSSNYSKGIYARMVNTRVTKNDVVMYKFEPASRNFLYWISNGFKNILEDTEDGIIYISNEGNNLRTREVVTILGVLEAFGVLRFKSLGGSNSQIYIYVNETKTMRVVRSKPNLYRNRLLENIRHRHKESVRMMNYLFQSGFTSDEIWDHLEDYFLGIGQSA